MVDLDPIIAGMAAAIRNLDFPDGAEIASALGVDLSRATMTTTKGGVIAIAGARLRGLPTAEVGMVSASAPHKRLDLVFVNSTLAIGPWSKRRRETVDASSIPSTAQALQSHSGSMGSTAE